MKSPIVALFLALVAVSTNAWSESTVIDFEGTIEELDPHPSGGLPQRIRTQGYEFVSSHSFSVVGGPANTYIANCPGCSMTFYPINGNDFDVESVDIHAITVLGPIQGDGTVQVNFTFSNPDLNYGVVVPITSSTVTQHFNIIDGCCNEALFGFHINSDFGGGSNTIGLDNIVVNDGTRTIDIDIQPNDPANSVRTDGAYSDKVYVSILGSDSLDVTQVVQNHLSPRFGPAQVPPFSVPGHVSDKNNDGYPDLTLKYRIADTGLTCGMTDEEVILAGATNPAGPFPTKPFEGADVVTTEACETASCHP